MRTAEFFYRLADHVSLICSICILVIQILDWYNPYMDFMGHATFLLYALCASSLWRGIWRIWGRGPSPKSKGRSRRKQRI